MLLGVLPTDNIPFLFVVERVHKQAGADPIVVHDKLLVLLFVGDGICVGGDAYILVILFVKVHVCIIE